jgi:uncharacterized spore protein YtfJ
MQRSALAGVFAALKVQLHREDSRMNKLMIGVAAAGFGALLATGGAQAQDTKTGTGTGADAGMKNAPTAATMGKKASGVKMMKRHKKHAHKKTM